MKALLITLFCGLTYALSKDFQPEQSGAWLTYALASNNFQLIEKGGITRAFFRNVSCEGLCDELSLRFYIKPEEKCLEYILVAERRRKSFYIAGYRGTNFFYIIRNTGDFLVFNIKNFGENGANTYMIVMLGKPGSILSEKQKEDLLRILKANHIPISNVQYVLEADDCPA